MKVNGKQMECNPKQTLKDFLMEHHYTLNIIAVERNGEIVAKENYFNVILSNTDTIEIVSFVGGG